MRYSFILIALVFNFSFTLLAQSAAPDKNIPEYNPSLTLQDSVIQTQYRRGIELQNNQQSYDRQYAGKDLQEEKRRLFPSGKFNSATGVWTELNPKVPRVTYAGIYFINKDSGWAVGDLGALIKTTDGGENWSVVETNTTLPLLKVRSFNGQIVLASGYDGLILRSTDGGETFNQVPSGVGNLFDLWGLEMVNDTLGWACGATALLKTTNGGESWMIVNPPGFTGNLWWIDFMNERYGFIAADGTVLKTTDGGNNWEVIQAGDYRPLYCLDIIDSLHIAAAGYGGTDYAAKNLYSSDGGYTWINGGFLTTEPVNDIKYINRDTGYIVMNNIISKKTTNRGQEWTGIDAGGEYEMQFLEEDNVGYSAGTGLRIYKTENGYENWQRLFINDNFSDIFFVNEQKGFAISSHENSIHRGFYKTTNGGISWNYVTGAPDGVDLFFLDSLTGFIGSNGIYKTTDGGENWYISDGAGVRSIFFVNETIGWAGTSWSSNSNSKILKTTNGGENWFEQVQNGIDGYTSIYFVDSLNGWATSRYIWQTTNGGDNWTQRTDIPTFFGTDIFFNGNRGFAIELLKLSGTTDFGNTWFTIFNPPHIIRKFGWLTNVHGFIIGDGVFETINSGDQWNELLELRNVGLRKIQSPTKYLSYTTGYLGLIYKYEDTTFVPVELISFSAELIGNNILLKWSTGTETNNNGFEIYRFASEISKWAKIGFIQGNGSSTISNSYSFTDYNITSGKYKYKLKQIDFNGNYKYSEEIVIDVITPAEFSLKQNYPNPFNSSTRIGISISRPSKIILKVIDVLGTELTILVNRSLSAGFYGIDFNASGYPSGVYFYSLKAEGEEGNTLTSVKKMIITK